jgi:hypothetical protein
MCNMMFDNSFHAAAKNHLSMRAYERNTGLFSSVVEGLVNLLNLKAIFADSTRMLENLLGVRPIRGPFHRDLELLQQVGDLVDSQMLPATSELIEQYLAEDRAVESVLKSSPFLEKWNEDKREISNEISQATERSFLTKLREVLVNYVLPYTYGAPCKLYRELMREPLLCEHPLIQSLLKQHVNSWDFPEELMEMAKQMDQYDGGYRVLAGNRASVEDHDADSHDEASSSEESDME